MSQQQSNTALKEYKDKLQQYWTRPVACQDQCPPSEPCRCLRHIVHVDALIAWLGRKLTEVYENTNLHRLLMELQLGDHRTFPLDYETYFTGELKCVRVFSLLLKQDRGHLIDRFYQSQMYDMILHQDGDYEGLRENLSDTTASCDAVELIIDEFQREKWTFCPLELQLHMDRPLEGTRVIVPFCHKIKLNEGGTASVYLVAVQEDLIRDERLKVELKDSLYEDLVHGKCYKMALKSYCGNKKSAFESEKDAFSALKSNIDVPIVRYLGSFTHDYGEGIRSPDHYARKTYNLLLEYGERDLYQYWADETNVPPVRVHEIIRFWEKLFEIAVAIRQIHHLDLSQGKNAPLKYYGWHADIKPENILFVNGRFKLADFGFSRFSPVAKSKNGTTPTEYIHGFTDTYGAPEISRMKQPNGTTSEVTQTIDTWSFGCVLSVAATWVVLGFQGVRQYETLRKLSPANKKDNKTYERFHNGVVVLPEVKKWHNYLRGHLRPSDTTTSMVLDFVEQHMLQTETYNRLEIKPLCKRLEKLIKDAKEEINNLDFHSKNTDAVVLQALRDTEREAKELSSRPKTTPLGRVLKDENGSRDSSSNENNLVPSRKSEAIRSPPLGLTTFREEILESELQDKSFTGGKEKQLQNEFHQGEMADSPIDAPLAELSRLGQKIPSSIDHYAQPDVPLQKAISSRTDPHNSTTLFVETGHRIASPPPFSNGNRTPSEHEAYIPEEHHAQSSYDRRSRARLVPYAEYLPTSDFGSDHTSQQTVPQWPPEGDVDTLHSKPATFPPRTHRNEAHNSPETQRRNLGTNFVGTNLNNPLRFSAPRSINQIQIPEALVPRRKMIPPSGYPTDSIPGSFEQETYLPTSPLSPISPAITITDHAERSPPPMPVMANPFDLHSVEKQVVTPEQDHGLQFKELPSTVYDLPYDVCRIRKDMDREKPKRVLSRLKGVFHVEERKASTALKNAYGNDREIIVVVDNGVTMFQHWPIAAFVVETLAKAAAGLDKDGIDVMFTVDGKAQNKSRIKGDNGRELLKQALDASWPANSRNDDSLTDMGQVFADIYEQWQKKGGKATTLLVLTDGDWSKTDHPALHETMLDFARQDASRAGKRHFGIQFIRFGEKFKDKLSWLDDALCQENQLKDIIDHCSWRSTVDKMFRGSVEGWLDQHGPQEQDMTYFYPHLVTFFRSFNEGELLSPASLHPARLSLSRSSSKGSASNTKGKKHESAPPVQGNSWQGHHRNAYSEQYHDKEYM